MTDDLVNGRNSLGVVIDFAIIVCSDIGLVITSAADTVGSTLSGISGIFH
jgi:hypothetical protein